MRALSIPGNWMPIFQVFSRCLFCFVYFFSLFLFCCKLSETIFCQGRPRPSTVNIFFLSFFKFSVKTEMTERQKDTETERHNWMKDRKTNSHRKTERQKDRKTQRQNWRKDRKANRKTDRQRDKRFAVNISFLLFFKFI